MAGTRGWPRWKFLVSARWLAWHGFVAATVVGMLWLGDWQFRRAEAGNALSWAYTFEWPFFAAMAIVFWAKTIRDEAYPQAPRTEQEVRLPAGAAAAGGDGGPDGLASGAPQPGAAPAAYDEELAAYNAYLARLHRGARGAR
jgi:hypothetical protein